MPEKTPLQIAYERWSKTNPYECTDVHSRKVAMHKFTYKPDEEVCEREQLWRQYVRMRDGNPSWLRVERSEFLNRVN